MRKKQVIRKRITGIVLLVAALAAFVFPMQKYYLRRIDNYAVRLLGFYLEEKDTLDVIVMGASDVYSEYNAAEVYRETGITSYPYSFRDNPVTLWKYELAEILKYQKPKLLIVELNGACYDEERLVDESVMRELADNMPFSANKMAMVHEYGKESTLSYIFPVIKYHCEVYHPDCGLDLISNRIRGYLLLRGAFTHTYNVPVKSEYPKSGDGSAADLDPLAEKCLREFMGSCRDSGIENVLFVRFPELIVDEKGYKKYQRYNRAAEIAEEYGFEYIDFSEMQGEMGIDRNSDYFNPEHMNPRGQKKLSDYMAEFMTRKYGLDRPAGEARGSDSSWLAEWDVSADYITRYYAYYEEYVREHPDEDRKDYNFKDDRKTIKALEAFGPVE